MKISPDPPQQYRQSSRASALRVHSMRRASIDSEEVFDVASPIYIAQLIASCTMLGALWKLSGLHVYHNHETFHQTVVGGGRSSHIGIPWQLKLYRLYCVIIATSYFANFALHFGRAGKTHTMVFLFLVYILVALPGQILCWVLHDKYNIHLFLMLSSFRRHKPKYWKHAGKVIVLIFATILTSQVYILVTFRLVDMPALKIIETMPRTTIWFSLSFWSWVPACFSLVLTLCLIMSGHYVEANSLKREIHDNYLKVIPKGDALYDLHVIFLRIVETSETWSKAIVWCLLSSSICFFFMLITYITDGMIYSVIPAMAIMLPALWIPALACGSVTARFIQIYISVNTRSPLLLPECDARNQKDRMLRRRNKGENEQGSDVKEGGEDEESWEKQLDGEALEKYTDEHDKLLELCKHLEDIFGVRVFGLKITASQILQLATFYGTGATLIIQNSGAWPS
mmetsp:Transcript_8130/g.16412  ORF Transcript_8130/g.16412 Transcript_8130/m.16412 type:complete len:455 (+) Transcript_8130:159-1523(+)